MLHAARVSAQRSTMLYSAGATSDRHNECMNCLDKLELLSPPFRQRIHTQLKNTDASVAGGIGTGITGITDGVLTQAPKFGGAPTAWLCLLQTSIGKKSHAELSGYSY